MKGVIIDVNFQEFCQQLGIKEPTQGLGHAYNYARVSSELLEESFGDTPLQCTVKNGACIVSFQTDLFGVSGSGIAQWASTLRMAQNFGMRKNGDEVVVTATFRI